MIVSEIIFMAFTFLMHSRS